MQEILAPPQKIVIRGMDESLIEAREAAESTRRKREENRPSYKAKWREFLPTGEENEFERKKWLVAYAPKISARKVISPMFDGNLSPEDLANWPYLVIVMNSARDSRPMNPAKPGEDILQERVINAGKVIAELFDSHLPLEQQTGYYLCPNGFPFHDYASLLISHPARVQKELTEKDLAEWRKFVCLTGQHLFFNSLGAGASRPERLHAQVIDPDAICYEGKPLIHPLLNDRITGRKKIDNDIYEVQNYPMKSFVFTGLNAHRKAHEYIRQVESKSTPFNLVIALNGDMPEVYVVPRNAREECLKCTKRRGGGLEALGFLLVGNIEDASLSKLGLNGKITAEEVFNSISYSRARDNLQSISEDIDYNFRRN